MTKFHRASVFGCGTRVPLDREQRAQFRTKLRLQRRPGRLTIAAARVGEVLVGLLGGDGRLDPAIATIAVLAQVSEATVKRALAQLRQFGFLTWERRLVRGAATGWRAEQTSNAYVLRVPACEAHFEPQVSFLKTKAKGAQETGEGWEAQVANATRMLLAMGAPVPAVWGSPCTGQQ